MHLDRVYEIMNAMHETRRRTVRRIVGRGGNAEDASPAATTREGDAEISEAIATLTRGLESLESLPDARATLDYEIGEIEKDLAYLARDDADFERFLGERTPGMEREVASTVEFLERPALSGRSWSFITDRDGTVNNYCGRYRSSHQSIWNACYLTRFIRACTTDSLILTAAPLCDDGLLSLSAMPSGVAHYAGSKGREYQTRDGHSGRMEIDPDRLRVLELVNDRIQRLLEHDEFRVFAAIGSGFQRKVGETTVARQDVHGSVPAGISARFERALREAVRSADPDGSVLSVHDAATDLEIGLLATERNGAFTKGDGLAFIDAELDAAGGFGPAGGLGAAGEFGPEGSRATLVCGDTRSDVSMVAYAVERDGPENVAAIFVTTDESLRSTVREITDRVHFVATPDVLVTALYRFSRTATHRSGR